MVMVIKGGWIESAERCPSPNHNDRPESTAPELLVIHNISLPPNRFGGGYIKQFFQNQLDRNAHPYFEEISELTVSAHLLIQRDGQVVQFVPFHKRAWHAGLSDYCGRAGCNDFSIGIELEGADDISYTQLQYTCLARVTASLIRQYPALNSDALIGHSDIAPGRKTDPGEAFNWNYYRNLLDAELMEEPIIHEKREAK